MGVSVWIALVTMMSPWLWLYSRQLWDNSFCIPLSALALAAYGDFLGRRRAWTLAVAGACAIFAVLVHLMALALMAPMLVHLVAFEYRQVWRLKWLIVAMVVVSAAFSMPYIKYLYGAHSTVAGDASIWNGLLYPLFGGHHLIAAGMDEVLGAGWSGARGQRCIC